MRPDGHGIWTHHPNQHNRDDGDRDGGGPDRGNGDGRDGDGDVAATVAFFLEHDTGTEPVPRLVDKVQRYSTYAHEGGPRWPVLFWLHSGAREHHLHQQLATQGLWVPVATASRDHTGPAKLSPAEAVWCLHGREGGLLTLADLAHHSPWPPPEEFRPGTPPTTSATTAERSLLRPAADPTQEATPYP